MLPAITEFLLLAIMVHRLGVLRAVSLPVVRIAGSPLAGTVPAYLAVFRIGCDLLPVIIGAALPLAPDSLQTAWRG